MAENSEVVKKKSVLYIRVMGDWRCVEELATRIGELLERDGYELLDQSGATPSQFKEGESKVHLMVR